MNNARYIILVLAVVIVLLVGLMNNKKDTVVDIPKSSDPFCYIWNTEAGDKAVLKFTVTGAEDDVTGSFAFLPAEKDSKSGDFSGTISKGTDISMIHGLLNASGEGVTNKEEIVIKVTGTIASVGFGEMKDRGDGVYVYANPDDISYAPNLQQTDCDALISD